MTPERENHLDSVKGRGVRVSTKKVKSIFRRSDNET